MTEDRGQRTDYRQCQAITTKGRRCRIKVDFYRIYEDNGLEYLCCKTHFHILPLPLQKGQVPPAQEG